MPDLCLCPGGRCPIKDRCYRFRALACGRQDSFGSPPYSAETGTCHAFADIEPMRPTDDAIRTRAYHLWVAAGRPEGRADAHWQAAQRELRDGFEAGLRPAVTDSSRPRA